MGKKIISTADAPAAIGTYSQAVEAGNTLWVSGQIPLDPATKELVPGGIDAEIHQVFKNLKAIVTAAGASFDDVVKATVFLTDLSHFALVNKIMAEISASRIRRARRSASPPCRAAPRSRWNASSPDEPLIGAPGTATSS